MNNQDKFPKGLTPNLPLWSYQLQQNSKLAVKTRKDLEIHLITRALKDEAFRQELIANPKVVVEKELGVKLPEELEIKVLEETEDTIYMVLPCNPYEGISEEDLKASLGMTYEDVAQWVLEQQRNTLLDEENSIRLMARASKDEKFKQELLNNPLIVIERELEEKIEAGIQLQILAESVNTLFIVIPNIMAFYNLYLQKKMDDINMPLVIGSGGFQATCGATPIIGCNTDNGVNPIGTSCAADVCIGGQRLPAAYCTDQRCRNPLSPKSTGYGCDII